MGTKLIRIQNVLGKAPRTPGWARCAVHPTHPVCVGACMGEAYMYAYMYMECKSFLNCVCGMNIPCVHT